MRRRRSMRRKSEAVGLVEIWVNSIQGRCIIINSLSATATDMTGFLVRLAQHERTREQRKNSKSSGNKETRK
jgi:hypothetical protein